MAYKSLSDLDPDYVKCIIEDVSESSMNVVLESDFSQMEGLPDMVESLAHVRRILKLVHSHLSEGKTKLKTA